MARCLGGLKGGLIAFTAGGLVGAALGVVLAPRTGEETRRLIREKCEDLTERMGDSGEIIRKRADELSRTVKDGIESGQDFLEEKKDILISTLGKAQESISNLKDRVSSH